MMKKNIFLFMLQLLIVLGFGNLSEARTLNILTTTTDLRSVVEFIGGERVRVESLGNGKQDYHFLAAKPSDMLKAQKADLFICSGLELEIGYESLILEGSRNKNIQAGTQGHLNTSMRITPLDVPLHVDRSMGDIHMSGNPHYWLDPLNMKIVAENIAGRLGQLSPEDADFFQSNLEAFNQKIDQKMVEWQEALKPFEGESILTYHKTFVYFAKRFGLMIVGELEPKPGVEPSAKHLQSVVELVNRDNIQVILQENIYPDKAARFVSSKTQAQVVVVPVSTLGDSGSKDYFLLMDTIVQQLSRGFQS
jgi:ABC-type Zn uptake system ZnuABC Zn-binding protein ZnuA